MYKIKCGLHWWLLLDLKFIQSAKVEISEFSIQFNLYMCRYLHFAYWIGLNCVVWIGLVNFKHPYLLMAEQHF